MAMFKLIILIEPEIKQETFFEGWPLFLEQAEQLPGLKKFVTAPVHQAMYGSYSPLMVHELHFESQPALEAALASEHGTAAGKILQAITGGKVSLLMAAHLEDSGENLRRFRAKPEPDPKG